MEVYHLTALKARSPGPRWQQGHGLFEDVRKGSAPGLSPASGSSVAGGSITPASHGALPVCWSVSRISPFAEDASHPGLGAHPLQTSS